MQELLLERIKKARLTKAQKQIAAYIIANTERVGMSSSMEIAHEIGVSDASITRFARAIGYSGFPELKEDIYANLAAKANGENATLSLTERFNKSQQNHGHTDTIHEYFRLTEYNAKKSYEQNSSRVFENIATTLIRAEHRYVIGFRGCLGVAMQFAWLLRFCLNHVVSISDEGSGGVGMIQDISEKDCVVIFSMSRFYKSDMKLIEIAKSRGAKICLITNNVLAPMAEYADYVIIAETRQVSFFHSTAVLTMISETLVSLVTKEQSASYHQKAEERDRQTEDYRIN